MRLFSELKRRNVFRMAVLYVLAAWLAMQVAGVLIDLGALPAGSGPWVLAVLAIGLPIALIFSWFFEITPEGLAREKDVVPGESITHVTGRRIDFIVIAMLCAGLILFAADKWWPKGPIERSIAVLAFDNMSGDPGEEYFSDGISEEILNLLAQIKPLKVIARQSSFSFKGKDVDIATIAGQLNVGWVLEGSVRRDGEQVRITAQLIDAKDSTHAWSQTYDRDLSAANLFHIQSEVARAVTRELHTTLTKDEERRLEAVPTRNTDAYAAYLFGRHRLTDRKVEWLAEAVEQFAQAIELDPEFAAAYSGLADACYLYLSYSGYHVHERCPPWPDPGAQNYRQALLPLARKAVQLDEELGEAWVSLGQMLLGEAESLAQVQEVVAAFERGLELNPSHSQGYLWYAIALSATSGGLPVLYGGTAEGWLEAWKQGTWQSVVKRGLEIDPLSLPLHYVMAAYPQWASTKEEAFWHARRMIEIAPDSPRGYERLAEDSWYLSGRIDEAVKWENKCIEIDPLNPAYFRIIGRAYMALGDIDMALTYFERGRQIFSQDSQFHVRQTLANEVLAWLESSDEYAGQRAREKAEQLDAGHPSRWFIDAVLDVASDQAGEWMTKYEQQFAECLTAEIDKEYVDECPVWLDRVLQEVGNKERARTAIEKRMEVDQPFYLEWPVWESRIARARYLAMLGRHEEALDELEKLVRSGWRGNYIWVGAHLRFVLFHDITLDAIRDHPRFEAMVDIIEADMAEQLENVREMERRGELPTLEEMRASLAQ